MHKYTRVCTHIHTSTCAHPQKCTHIHNHTHVDKWTQTYRHAHKIHKRCKSTYVDMPYTAVSTYTPIYVCTRAPPSNTHVYRTTNPHTHVHTKTHVHTCTSHGVHISSEQVAPHPYTTHRPSHPRIYTIQIYISHLLLNDIQLLL